jgi:hypothetical protein
LRPYTPIWLHGAPLLTLQRKKMFWAPQKNAYLVLARSAASHRERHQRHG